MESQALQPFSIAIDGPSGAGKSTLARDLARCLGIGYLDTGAMYRALGYQALTEGLDPASATAIEPWLAGVILDVQLGQAGQQTLVNGLDVSAFLRSPAVSMAASDISALPAVRHYCVERQRAIAARQSLVLDGRDIGSYVLPDAPLKFFLTASEQVRAARRHRDLRLAGREEPLSQVLEDLRRRDRQDGTRELAPTCQAADAILIDTSQLTAEEVLERMLAVVSEKGFLPTHE